MEEPVGPEPSVANLLQTLSAQLERLARPEHELVQPEVRAAEAIARRLRPAWQRSSEGEQRLPVGVAVTVAIALQLELPAHLQLGTRWVLPALEGGVLLSLVVANPRRIDRASTVLRMASITLIALASLANAWSSARLVGGLINGTEGESARPLLTAGASIYLTNIIVFSLWYWDWDRGGPVARAKAERIYPDFLFPQMATPAVAPPDWRPSYLDYLYLSFTNATAFSPTDTMPLARWAKMLMLLQSAVAIVTVALVVARAVNILK
jgi:uncharacterized membrane protein